MNKCVYFFMDEDNHKETGKALVSRYVKKNLLGKNEIDILLRLKQLPECNKFFHVCETIEDVKIAELGTNAYNLQSVNFIKDDHSMLLRYKDQKLLYLDGFLSSLSCSRKYILLLIDFYRRLLSNIHLLVSSNIIHNNIGFKSIVVNSFELPILTNFRLALDLTKAGKMGFCKEVFTQYIPGHIYWPPEIHLLSYIITNKLSSLSLNNLETVFHDISHNTKVRNDAVAYFAKYVNMNCDHIIEELLRFSGTWDQYALGQCYLKLIGDLQKNIKTSNNFVVMFLELLQETVELVPSRRPLVSKMMNKYRQLLDNADINQLYSLFSYTLNGV
uniref:Protein kinase domain-containing protein n=1 Tax=viral metagenome TaxID=1070528 RepID=A0A6C0I8P6_9ZZZZ